jgi:hypothetical protein
MMWHTPPDEGRRKLDIHACYAGMNIKFPFFSCGQQSGYKNLGTSTSIKKTALLREKGSFISQNRIT